MRSRAIDRGPLVAELRELEAELTQSEKAPLDHLERALARLGASLEAASAREAQQRFRRRRIVLFTATPVVVASLVAGVSTGLSAHEEALACGVHGRYYGQPHLRARFFENMQLVAFSCVAETELDCSARCHRDGLCSVQDGDCVASEPSHCTQSWACIREGRCTLEHGACIVGSDDECAQSEACKRDGLCRVQAGGCRFATEASCLGSARCRTDGHCSTSRYSPGCVAKDDKDCAASEACLEKHACFHNGLGSCTDLPQETEEDAYCARLRHCVANGFCDAGDLDARCDV